MRKIFNLSFIFILSVLTLLLVFLSTTGIETKRFNSLITKKIKESNANIDLNLDTIKFNMLSANIKNKVVALGGINSSNFFKIKLTKSKGFASISWIKKNGLNKI